MVFSRIRTVFHKHRLLGNIVVYTGLFTGADVLCQKLQHRGADGGLGELDVPRTARMGIMGSCFYGPFSHYCYMVMDRVLPGTAVRTVAAKCFIDMFGVSVFTLNFFFTGMSLMEGKSVEETKAEVKKKFPQAFVSGIFIWPPAQAVNFAFIPPAYRVVYISTVAFFWTVFMSYIKSTPETPGFLRFVDRITAGEKPKS